MSIPLKRLDKTDCLIVKMFRYNKLTANKLNGVDILADIKRGVFEKKNNSFPASNIAKVNLI